MHVVVCRCCSCCWCSSSSCVFIAWRLNMTATMIAPTLPTAAHAIRIMLPVPILPLLPLEMPLVLWNVSTAVSPPLLGGDDVAGVADVDAGAVDGPADADDDAASSLPAPKTDVLTSTGFAVKSVASDTSPFAMASASAGDGVILLEPLASFV